jgi:hypothetical protein
MVEFSIKKKQTADFSGRDEIVGLEQEAKSTKKRIEFSIFIL